MHACSQHHEYAEFRSALELLEVGACLVCRGALLCNANTIYRVIRVQVTGHVDRIAKIEAADPAIDVSQFKRLSLWGFDLREFHRMLQFYWLINRGFLNFEALDQ